jgi:hypothetical protein
MVLSCPVLSCVVVVSCVDVVLGMRVLRPFAEKYKCLTLVGHTTNVYPR